MSAVGLQVWDEAGRLMLDGTHRLGRIKKMVKVGDGPGVCLIEDIQPGEQIFYSFQPNQLFFDSRHNECPPWFQIVNGNAVTWDYSPNTSTAPRFNIQGMLIVGVY
ncbi:hypothetical protein [Paraburkholderia rhizosphaerae]|uniref:Uncharacterized protein n=1 Tax=Paraburkholderia rhizosphaerae TaxID=480658 RepID=A0A4R8LPW4_9BURK|nr:hypothetical protein [Paraburkholderia rhizosphaerae]TDY46483.1 hypothetical protein BX592_113111 [Paraburkholderia rhizosphaerae]